MSRQYRTAGYNLALAGSDARVATTLPINSAPTSSYSPSASELLEVEQLNVSFEMYDPAASYFSAQRICVDVLHDLSYTVYQGEVLAVVGASGSGKTVMADAVMGLYEPNASVRGIIRFEGQPCDAKALSHLRGNGISLVPQSVSHLNPLMRIGKQIVGAAHGERRRLRMQRMYELLEEHGLPEYITRMFPHELSGGMARRVLLICALLDEPRLLIADEPTPGLDEKTARAALEGLRRFADTGGGVLLITHDIELAATSADRVAVFLNGTIIEEATARAFIEGTGLNHPYTQALRAAMPENGMHLPEVGVRQ